MRLVLVLLLVTSNAAQADHLVPGVWMYRNTALGEGLFATVDEGCKKWAEYRATQGYKHTFKSARKNTDPAIPMPQREWSYICRYYDHDNKLEWDQPSSEAVWVCPVDATPMSSDNSGTVASQVCSCPDDKACAMKQSGTSGGSKPATDEKSPPAPEVSARCTQREWNREKSAAAAKRESAANKERVRSNAELRRIAKDYDQAKKQLIKEMREKLEAHADASNATPIYPTHYFPRFTDKDMCDVKGVTVTDVNIGWLCGSRKGDFAAANNVAGYGVTPPGCTWHHHEELGRMQLVKSDAHQATSHHGGVSIWSRLFGIAKYPGY